MSLQAIGAQRQWNFFACVIFALKCLRHTPPIIRTVPNIYHSRMLFKYKHAINMCYARGVPTAAVAAQVGPGQTAIRLVCGLVCDIAFAKKPKCVLTCVGVVHPGTRLYTFDAWQRVYGKCVACVRKMGVTRSTIERRECRGKTSESLCASEREREKDRDR